MPIMVSNIKELVFNHVHKKHLSASQVSVLHAQTDVWNVSPSNPAYNAPQENFYSMEDVQNQ